MLESTELDDACDVLAAFVIPEWLKRGVEINVQGIEYEVLAIGKNVGPHVRDYFDRKHDLVSLFCVVDSVDITHRYPVLIRIPFGNGDVYARVDADTVTRRR